MEQRRACAAGLDQVKTLGLEGIVAKRSTSIYIPGKESNEWQKHRFNYEDTFCIGGYIPGTQGICELLIGEFRPLRKELHFIGRLIAGLNKSNRREIYRAVQDLKTKKVMAECIWANRSSHGKSNY
jgi:ATP-dependent DNA ligase